LTCENISQRDEVFLDLSVDLEEHSSVTSCLRKFSEEEMLCERNKFHCDICGGLQEAEKRMKIKKLPRILALHLKRFKYTEDMQRLHKLFHRVVYPYYLRLFNTTDDAEDPDRLYELYAVVIHIGNGPYHGHYVSIIKTQDRGWLLFDDELVEPVDKSYVRNFFGGLQANGQPHVASAYVLFYQETTFEAMQRDQEADGLADLNRVAELPKEGVAVGEKANGFANGSAHHYTPATPAVEEHEPFASLDHAATANVAGTGRMSKDELRSPDTAHADGSPLEYAATLPVLQGRKSLDAFLGKKEKAREDKERKAREKEAEKERKAAEKEAEKEREKQAREKRVEMEQKRRDNYKRQEDELKAAMAASKATKAEEDKRSNVVAAAPSTSVGGAGTATAPAAAPAAESQKENGVLAGGLSRFRPTSLTIKKPKFWKDKHGDAGEVRDATHAHAQQQHQQLQQQQDHQATAGAESAAAPVMANSTPEKKNRFSLGRKKSTTHLF